MEYYVANRFIVFEHCILKISLLNLFNILYKFTTNDDDDNDDGGSYY